MQTAEDVVSSGLAGSDSVCVSSGRSTAITTSFTSQHSRPWRAATRPRLHTRPLQMPLLAVTGRFSRHFRTQYCVIQQIFRILPGPRGPRQANERINFADPQLQTRQNSRPNVLFGLSPKWQSSQHIPKTVRTTSNCSSTIYALIRRW